MASQNRKKLHHILKEVSGLENVYFQPPATIKLSYPCIIYSLLREESKFADNLIYKNKKKYKIMCIDTDPDTDIPDKILTLTHCSRGSDRYTVNNLYHDVFNLYF